MSERPSWNQYFMIITRQVAERSTCLRAKVGAVIVRDRSILATGYNGSPAGLPHCTEVGCLIYESRTPDGEIEQNRTHYKRNPHGSELEPDSLMFEITSNPTGGFEPEHTAAGERDAMNAVGHVQWTEKIPFLGSTRSAANIAAGHSSAFAQDRGAAGQSVIIRCMAHQDSRDVGKAFHR